MPVSKHIIELAYQLFLGREPESAEVVAHKALHLNSLAEVRDDFMRSVEFLSASASVTETINSHLESHLTQSDNPKIQVEGAASELDSYEGTACIETEMRLAREATIEIGSKKYVISSDDSYLDYIGNGFEPEMVVLFGVLASRDDVVLDVGANIGCTAILFGELCRSVCAFEPSFTTFAFLEKNVANSGLRNVILRNIGLGEDAGEYTLISHPSNRSGSFVSNRVQASPGHTLEKIVIRRLDDTVESMNLPKIDLIKIDVEGFEGHVLRGATRTLSSCRPLVVLELNHWCLNAFQRVSIPDFLDFLRSRFPILLAVDGSSYLNLHDAGESYIVMYHHILQMRFPNIVAAFDEVRLSRFRDSYRHHFVA